MILMQHSPPVFRQWYTKNILCPFGQYSYLEYRTNPIQDGIPFTLRTRDESPQISNLCREFVNNPMELVLFKSQSKI